MTTPEQRALQKLARTAVEGTNEDRRRYLEALADQDEQEAKAFRAQAANIVQKYLERALYQQRVAPYGVDDLDILGWSFDCVEEIGL